MAANYGNTAYTLEAEYRLEAGYQADGRAIWVANADATNTVTVEISGAHEGNRIYTLAGKGDQIIIPTGDVSLVTISASAYPTVIGWGYLIPGMRLATGIRR